MRTVLIINGIIAVLLFFAVSLAFLMDSPSLRFYLPSVIIAVVSLLGLAVYNNHLQNKKFRKFIQSKKDDKDLQEELQRNKLSYKDKTGRAKVPGKYTTRKIGNLWTGNNLHGAIPTRQDRRKFLTKN